jgi:threonine/homoserine/homoserine lactone efflux protein
VSSVGAFALFAAVLAITPGLDTMLVLRTTARRGRRVGLAAVAGVGLGCVVWVLASALGVTAVLAASRLAFEVLRVAGVGYLCWLGVRALWLSRRPVGPAGTAVRASPVAPTVAEVPVGPSVAAVTGVSGASAAPGGLSTVESRGLTAGWALRTGFTTNLLNPKVGVFYLSVLPQFLPAGLGPLAGSLVLGAIHIGEGAVWLSVVVLAVNRFRGWFARPALARWLERLTGVVLLAFGLRLALDPPPALR